MLKPVWSRQGPPVLLLLILTMVFAIAAGVLAWEPWARTSPAAQPTGAGAPPAPSPADAPAPAAASAAPTRAPTPQADPAVFTIGAVGDVLPHDTPIRVAHQGGSDYDFTPLLEATRAWSEGVDLALCNMEVPLALPGEAPSGYPRFGAPEQLAANLADLGWDGCSTGTNHTLDRGAENAEYTLDRFDEVGLGHAGSARSEQEEARAQFYELQRGGQTIRVAQIGGTYGTNGLPIPPEKPWVVSLLDSQRIIERAERAREDGADLVIATLHWGNEYELAAADGQRDLAAELAESGAIDLVIGSHPHVPQEFAKLDGGPAGEGMWVAYSLGNFISNQDSYCCIPETATGLFLTATVTKPAGAPARVTGMEWTPITIDRLGDNYVYPLLDLLEEHPERLTLADEVLRDRLARVEGIMTNSTGAEFAMRAVPPAPTGPPAVVIPRSEGAGSGH